MKKHPSFFLFFCLFLMSFAVLPIFSMAQLPTCYTADQFTQYTHDLNRNEALRDNFFYVDVALFAFVSYVLIRWPVRWSWEVTRYSRESSTEYKGFRAFYELNGWFRLVLLVAYVVLVYRLSSFIVLRVFG